MLLTKSAITRLNVSILSTFMKKNATKQSLEDFAACSSSRSASSSTSGGFGDDKLKFSETRAFGGDISGMPIYKQSLKPKDLSNLEWPEDISFPKKLFITASVVACLVYFWNREPNDLDELLDQPLWKSVPAYERDLLMEKIAVAKAHGENEEKILDMEKRVEEIDTKVRADQQSKLKK